MNGIVGFLLSETAVQCTYLQERKETSNENNENCF